MKTTIEQTIENLAGQGNLRTIPADGENSAKIDFTSNDYLGIASRTDFQEKFFADIDPRDLLMSASASRLLARRQKAFSDFENELSEAYGGRKALVMNSGYHANAGLVSAFAAKGTIVLADRLVHASIIDGIRLSGAPFERFRHNDAGHLSRLASKAAAQGLVPLIIAESVYSMDGDKADIEALAEVKNNVQGAMLYIDEAHAVGVEGNAGRGLCYSSPAYADVDIIVGTLGKALGSVGAYAIMNDTLRDYAINKARSFIFSTALPPLNVEWSRFVFRKMMEMDNERAHLRHLCARVAGILRNYGVDVPESHIQPLHVGDPVRAVALSKEFAKRGIDVLPIRTPTVPPGTDRLRLSLSAAMTDTDIDAFAKACETILPSSVL